MPTTSPHRSHDLEQLAVAVQPIEAYIGLGSNLNGPAAQIRAAFEALDRIGGTRLIARSSLYRSAPMGPVDQPEYVNAVAAVSTTLSPHALLDQLLWIEQHQGRHRDAGTRWGPRTLDLDILLYGPWRVEDARLTVPHPGLHMREFVLHPLAEIAPDLEIPGHGRVRDLVGAVPDRGILRLTEGP